MRVAKGIGEKNRELLDLLHRKSTGPFTVADAAVLLGLERTKSRRLLAHLATCGWLSRIRQNTYAPVPLGATSPTDWREDPWVVAAKTFTPCYLGGWTACEHWGLTEQLFRGVVVMTGKRPRKSTLEVQGTSFHLKFMSDEKRFGTKTVWRGQTQIQISDPSRTVIDMLDDPGVGGGIRQIADVLASYFGEPARNDAQLLEYARRLGNRTVFKRLGYLLEACGIDAPAVAEACHKEMSTGLSLLDPTAKPAGRILKRWNLRVNATVAKTEERA